MLKPMALAMLLSVTVGLSADGLDYPEQYRALGLPEYEQAVITALGRDNSNLHDGVNITLYTAEGSAALREFYEAEMQSLGWALLETTASARMRAAGMLNQWPFGATFNKDGLRYQIMTSPQGDGSTIHITVAEEEFVQPE